MIELTQSNQPPVSMNTGCLDTKWKSLVFHLVHRRVFLSKIEGILNAAAGHEGNSLPPGSHEYQVLSASSDGLCEEFAGRFGIDPGLLRARIPGLAKLAGLSVPPPTRNYARLAWLGMLLPLGLFFTGLLSGLFILGYHLVAGGR